MGEEMSRRRDSQRSRVYAWERAYHTAPTFKTIDEVTAYVAPIWRAERGRYGRAKVPPPNMESSSWGQRAAIAHFDHRITLPRWARQPAVILHELAHRLMTAREEAHGPRFVGCLIGLLARHAGLDAYKLMADADAAGVKYHVRSIGAVPVTRKADQLLAILPCTVMEAAFALDCTWRQVHGYLLQLRGRARLYRGKIVAVKP